MRQKKDFLGRKKKKAGEGGKSLEELRREVAYLRLKLAGGQLTNVRAVKMKRKDLARVLARESKLKKGSFENEGNV